jgi:hypothetical protein
MGIYLVVHLYLDDLATLQPYFETTWYVQFLRI